MRHLIFGALLICPFLVACVAVSSLDEDTGNRNDSDARGRGDEDVGTIDPNDDTGERDAGGGDVTTDDADDPDDTAAIGDTEGDGDRETGADADATEPLDTTDAAGDDTTVDAATDALLDTAEDAAEPGDVADATADVVDDVAADTVDAVADTVDAAEDVGGDDGVDFDADPLAPPPRGSYAYTRISVPGLLEMRGVDIHPDNDLALIVERQNVVRVFDITASTISSITITPTSGVLEFEDVAWSPDGSYALVVGRNVDGTEETGFVIEVDNTLLRTVPDDRIGEAFTSPTAPVAHAYAAIDFSPLDGSPTLLARNETAPGVYTFSLRRYDPVAGTFRSLGSQSSTAGCQDLAWVRDEAGDYGIFVTCGDGGYDGWFYSDTSGTVQWRNGAAQLGNGNLGSAPRVAAHPAGIFAFVISTVGRAIYRLEDGRINASADATRFSLLPLQNVAFSPDGLRALVIGGVTTSTNRGVVLEYRYDAYACTSLGAPACGFTDVSIPGFQATTWGAPSQTLLYDADWRTDCDGGLIVGGYESYGVIAAFSLETPTGCAW